MIVSASLKQWGRARVLAILPKKKGERKIELVLLLQSALFSEIKQRTCSVQKTPFLPPYQGVKKLLRQAHYTDSV